MRAKKMAPPLNVREYAGITWVWASDAVYHPHWRNAGRTPIARIFCDQKGGRILLIEGVRRQVKFRGKNSDQRAFTRAARFVQMSALR
jgi:hypothetical protein